MHRELLAALVLAGLAVAFAPARVGVAAQNREQAEPETYHWVLPVNQPGVDVATLHPNDCYVVQRAEGVAYFGRPSAAVLEFQRQLRIPTAHLVETREDHPECTIGACLRVEDLAAALEREFTASATGRLLRSVDHRPTPLDNWYGGAYTDVGSDDRETFGNAREQQMLFQHLATDGRGNYYEAKVPRTLSIHVRDRGNHAQRTGVYRGFLYIEHHHPLIVGKTIAEWRRLPGSYGLIARLAPLQEITMKRHLLSVGIALALAAALSGQWSGPVAQETDPTNGQPAYRFEEIADGVYFAAGTGAMTTMSNSMVIVNDDHAMLVDTSVTPAAARKLVAEIKSEVTDKPIRYVFNSYYHFDHAHGNQIFGDDVEIIGHEFVRRVHLSNPLEHRTSRSFSAVIPMQIERLKTQIAEATDATERARLQTDLRVREAHWNALQETRVTPPNVTYSDVMTIVKGGREVQLHFLGRGRTGGDTMVFLPEERIVFTGDFFEGRPGAGVLAYMGDGFVDEWPASLERLKGFDFDVIVPGHGLPFSERTQIDDFQDFLRDLWAQVSKLRADGLSVEDATARVDMSKYEPVYGGARSFCRSPRGSTDLRVAADRIPVVTARDSGLTA